MEMKLLVLNFLSPIHNLDHYIPLFYACRAVHNFFQLGGAMSLAEVENKVAIHSRGVWGHAPQ